MDFFFTWIYSLLPVKLILIIFLPGLTLYCQSNSFSSFHLDLLSIASQSSRTHSHHFHLDLLSIASRTHLHLFIWTYSLSPVKLIFLFSSGLTLYRQSNSFSSFHLDLLSIASRISFFPFHLDLLSIASQSHFHLFIWTYSLLPVKLIFIFSFGLTLYCQSNSFSSF